LEAGYAGSYRLSPNTLKKKLDKIVWQPSVSAVNATMTIRNVSEESSGPKECSFQKFKA
jgi:hypothetical protein